jgi:hypothetical protein
MRAGRANLITALGPVALLLAVVLTAPRWTRLLTRDAPDEAGEEPAASPVPAAEPAAAADATQKISVKLFFLAPDQAALLIEDREVAYSADLAGQVRTVVEELVKGSQKGLVATLAPETRVIDAFVANGVAYVDLSGEASSKHAGGSRNELLTVYSVVNSLTSNFPAVKRVQILLDDRQAATLAGHVDLTRPLASDLTFLAGATPSPGPAAPSGAPAPAPRS